MQKLFFVSLLFLASCQPSKKFKIGDCVQRPDQNSKWKILKIENENTWVSEVTTNEKKEIDTSKMWILTECQGPF